jgi:hypothetical protein
MADAAVSTRRGATSHAAGGAGAVRLTPLALLPSSQARQCPDLPPSFSMSWMPSMRMPRSTALHMQLTL